MLKLVLRGNVAKYLETVKKSTEPVEVARLAHFKEANKGRNVDAYVKLFKEKFVGSNYPTIYSEENLARAKIALLSICDLRQIIPFSNSFYQLLLQVGDYSDKAKDEYFRKNPRIGNCITESVYFVVTEASSTSEDKDLSPYCWSSEEDKFVAIQNDLSNWRKPLQKKA